MKHIISMALTTALVMAAAGLQAQQYLNGDLLVGFSGGSSDFIFNLGQSAQLTLGQTWNVGAARGTRFGVVGAYVSSGMGSIFATSPLSDEGGFDPTGAYAAARTGVATLAGTPQAITLGQSRTLSLTDPTGWTYQTDQPVLGSAHTFQTSFFDPNVNIGSTAYFFENRNDGTVEARSFFTYDVTSGLLAYGVPEPSSLALFISSGVVAWGWRRQRKQA